MKFFVEENRRAEEIHQLKKRKLELESKILETIKKRRKKLKILFLPILLLLNSFSYGRYLVMFWNK